ncbi:shikimate dehydrogenase [Buchnera aphidicola]|uniref:shikimate dehydrogenase n=1 Tax=Buchnera aphidicola TaxID=9 RepID=UPI002237B707|nr:shikimate dehydrogenase [Buchnera aphidicola]MCW5197510.1 shikimate dehydrogenase [Buchnera aphidicola (Chaitophorus viminalis)]
MLNFNKNICYAVFGNPINHSKSPKIHNFFFKKYNFNEKYIRICASKQFFLKEILNFFENGGKGANITLPFKEKVFSICTVLTKRAQISGSINTLKKNNIGIIGDNTDGIGLLTDLKYKNLISKNDNILILGAGGAARGIIYPLLKFGCNIYITNRTIQKAKILSKEFLKFGYIKYLKLNQLHKNKFQIIINATSAGISDHSSLVIPSNIFNQKTICYDMFYGNTDTNFMKLCKNLGSKKVYNGIGMLVNQAAHSFFLWTDIFPKINDVFNFLKK